MKVLPFLEPEELFDTIRAGLPADVKSIYDAMRHTRIEPVFRDRKFVIYRSNHGDVERLATLAVRDFVCDDEEGATTELEWLEKPGKSLCIGYTPTQVFDFPILVHLPINNKIRWSTKRGDPSITSLSFLMVLRTQTRRNLREHGKIYMETLSEFQKEFCANKAG